MNDEIIVDVSCLRHVYPGGVRVDICGFEFHVCRGQRVAVLGPNGSGKSTLLKHVLGILKPTDGSVRVFGEDPARDYDAIRSRIGAVMQNVDEQLIGPTVFDDVAFAPLNFGLPRQETFRRVEDVLRALDIYELRDRLPHYLSGGERKKVALAGALASGPELLIMDEPLEGIDYASRIEISDFLARLHRQSGMTMVSTLHDMEMVSRIADYGYVMRHGGELELRGTIEEIFFEHDLSEFNLAPPAVVNMVKDLRARGLPVTPTLDMRDLEDELTRLLRWAA